MISHDNFQIEALPEEEEANQSALTKKKSKVALAKKILNKKIKVNTKIVFDEEGEVREGWKEKGGGIEREGWIGWQEKGRG